ncbi:MAG: excinuclease ABC subunit UvrC [Oscillospiraceae bacterium]|nr:excinuclease ABC subunit UvrC [Oscillospiraceae bacterium]
MLAINDRLPYLRGKTAKLTDRPGCYIMKNSAKDIIYIGKAKNLRNRVSSYFRKDADHLPKVAKMVSNVYDYDFIITDSEFEALVLECSLIKQYRPKYNILLKDDKGYSYIKITNEEYPRLKVALQKEDDMAQYIGPYTSSYAVKQAVLEANRVFRLPTCTRRFPQEFKKQRPCLNFHINRCMGLCEGKLDSTSYRQIIDDAVKFIKNGSEQSVEEMTRQMLEASENLEFERAAMLRDRINAITKASETQKIVDESRRDCDAIAAAILGDNACISVVMYRDGRLFDKASFFLGLQDDTPQMREEFVMQYYSSRDYIPKDIFLDIDLEQQDRDNLTTYLKSLCSHAINISTPKRGNPLSLVRLSASNASEYLSIKVGRSGREITALDELARALGLSKPPKIIECYDISNLGSTNIVAGMVVFENGRPNKKLYRKFSLKNVFGKPDDYASMREVIERRFRRYLDGDEGFSVFPDLIFLDGGQGHVNAVLPLLNDLGIETALYGLVKDSKHRTRAIATGGGEISLSVRSEGFKLITRIQDEVHRYALSFQKAKRKASAYQLELTKVKGIGQKKAMLLLTKFKTTKALKQASVTELCETAKISEGTARELIAVIEEM